jgi:hypothetical protein
MQAIRATNATIICHTAPGIPLDLSIALQESPSPTAVTPA